MAKQDSKRPWLVAMTVLGGCLVIAAVLLFGGAAALRAPLENSKVLEETVRLPEETVVQVDTKDPRGVSERVVKLKDGREVLCITWHVYNGGGPSCDWGNAK